MPPTITTTDIAIAVLTGILVLITGFYAWATFQILRANRRVVEEMQFQAEQSVRPYIIASVGHPPGNPILRLRIKNTGRTPAEKVRLGLDRDFIRFGDENRGNLRDYTAFTEEIDSLAPDQTLEFYLNVSHRIFNKDADRDKNPLQFSVTATYQSGEKKYNDVSKIDLRPLLHTTLDRPEDIEALQKLGKSAEKIERHLGAIARSLDRDRV